MWQILNKIILFFCLARLDAKDIELPLCPTNMQFFPQNLPMHCRLPIPSVSLRPLSGKSMEYLPPPIPGFPGPIPGPMPGSIPGPFPGSFPGPMPGMIPGPMPMPMPPQSPSHKLPVVVMPFYSPDTKKSYDSKRRKKHRFGYKKRPKHFYSTDEDSSDTGTSTDDSMDGSSENDWWKKSRSSRRSNRHRSKRRKHQNKDLLTPVLQYVTKDGYVIFEKHISRGEAKNWLGNKKADFDNKGPQLKNDENPVSKESRDDNRDTKFIRDDENIEVKTEDNPHQSHQKKNLKRKLSKKHVAD